MKKLILYIFNDSSNVLDRIYDFLTTTLKLDKIEIGCLTTLDRLYISKKCRYVLLDNRAYSKKTFSVESVLNYYEIFRNNKNNREYTFVVPDYIEDYEKTILEQEKFLDVFLSRFDRNELENFIFVLQGRYTSDYVIHLKKLRDLLEKYKVFDNKIVKIGIGGLKAKGRKLKTKLDIVKTIYNEIEKIRKEYTGTKIHLHVFGFDRKLFINIRNLIDSIDLSTMNWYKRSSDRILLSGHGAVHVKVSTQLRELILREIPSAIDIEDTYIKYIIDIVYLYNKD